MDARVKPAHDGYHSRLITPFSLTAFCTIPFLPAAHFCARGLHLCFTDPESRGGRSAEKRSGARRNTPWGIMTRYARRLRGALRPMTRRTTRRDNVRISTLISASVPIVSQSVVGFSPL